MAKLLSKCEGCRKVKFFVTKRNYKTNVGVMKSQSELCGKCFKGISKILPKPTKK